MDQYELVENRSSSTSTDIGDLETLIGEEQHSPSCSVGDASKWSLASIGNWYASERINGPATSTEWSPVDPMAHAFIPALEGLRGMAVSFTVLSHCLPGPQNMRDAIGSMGVTIFFVLSGFLITAVLIRVEVSGTVFPSR
jgi:hypothetical protein